MKPALFALLGFFGVGTCTLSAQEKHEIQHSEPQMKAALDLVVTRQLAAFGTGNFSLAYTYAATGIQKMFPLAEFEKMVRTGYPIMLASPKADFGIALDDGQTGVVFVELKDSKGSQKFRYLLTHETLGWKIAGVEQIQETKKPSQPTNMA